jgi:undecaprenyl-diphosphatase
MDWTLFRWLNGLLDGHDLLGDEVADFSALSPVLVGLAVIGLWFCSRPGGLSGGKLACASALASAAAVLAVNQAISTMWSRPRPSDAHPGDTVLHFVAPSADPSFPSDHAAAAFAIAFAVLFIHRRAGYGFLIAASAVGLSRVLVGLHYPGDVLAGAAVGFVVAWVVTRVLRRPLMAIVTQVSRIIDPLVRPIWHAAAAMRPLGRT